MSLHDLPPPRKRSRLGLYLPFAIALVVVIGWSVLWLWARGEARARMDASVAQLKAAGYDVSWKERGIGGYPLRLNITLTEARVREPSGWGLEAPVLEGQAYMHAPTHWMLAAPQGLTFVRPIGGPVVVKGEVIRASLKDLDKRPPSFSLQGAKLIFQPTAGAQPFGLEAAELVELHLRPGPDDEGLLAAEVKNGKARLSGLLGRIAADKPVQIIWNSRLTKMSSFEGSDWPTAVRRWSDAGGQMRVVQAGVTAGDALLGSNSGLLNVGTDGRLRGMLDVTLKQAPRALGAMSQTGVIQPEAAGAAAAVAEAREGAGDVARVTINFQAGQTTLGPVAVGPAPKVYEVR
ncbi:DUF2125 domain-containing protein [Phenylobacterium sp. J367]|uniref:DUF2125 domain-containing protein n=1 Tax=Phenylobacterium sp. J367 TaxID=2898435 RepID=UPI002151DEC6|nr:DUF2125 domain-containing protein [Phenylobacterium sp. J367]MCR5877204.1 DUF2125 domain-containing protein [Phenylobacterium sp. J367]